MSFFFLLCQPLTWSSLNQHVTETILLRKTEEKIPKWLAMLCIQQNKFKGDEIELVCIQQNISISDGITFYVHVCCHCIIYNLCYIDWLCYLIRGGLA